MFVTNLFANILVFDFYMLFKSSSFFFLTCLKYNYILAHFQQKISVKN